MRTRRVVCLVCGRLTTTRSQRCTCGGSLSTTLPYEVVKAMGPSAKSRRYRVKMKKEFPNLYKRYRHILEQK